MNLGSTQIEKEEEVSKMSTKGASLRYGNTKGSNHKGTPTEHIGFAWAKGFNRGGLTRHFNKHGKEFDCKTKEEYEAKAVSFANTIDRKNAKSVVDKNGTTYKYNPKTNVMVEVTKDGYIVSYRHYGKEFWYLNKRGEKVWIRE